jgi:hypothetical protein
MALSKTVPFLERFFYNHLYQPDMIRNFVFEWGINRLKIVIGIIYQKSLKKQPAQVGCSQTDFLKPD